ncbi:Ribonuclease-like protein [Dirofilaria immitis]|nr:Ribonuclease-like protein [Dirofilaria immitis]
MPRMMIPAEQTPATFFDRPQDFAKFIYVARMVEWQATAQFARGKLYKSLGMAGDIEAETEGLLLANDVDTREFSQAALSSLPITEAVEWKIDEKEFKYRKDFRDETVFTIDPSTARDLDDALHIKPVLDCDGTGNPGWEVGVHIADVSYFVQFGTELDHWALNRGTSVYLVHKVIPMLPQILCEELCSLNPNVDRLTFSVVWKINDQGEVFDEWFGRTIIRSCCKLSYEHAQDFILHPEKDFVPSELPEIFNGRKSAEVKEAVLRLHKVAVILRKKRFENGSLYLDMPKLSFALDEISGMPNGLSLQERKESSFLVEEFMLLANIAVARKIESTFPKTALLRRHPPPKIKMLRDILEKCEKVGFSVDGSSSATISSSLRKYEGDTELKRTVVQMLTYLLMKSMQLASYFCVGSLKNRTDYAHYALSVPFYTHFTSPIRRYPDIMVRPSFLSAALGYSPAPGLTVKEVETIASHCNDRKLAAKTVSEASDDMFLECGPLTERAVVIQVLDASFDVLVVKYGVVKRVYTSRLRLAREPRFIEGPCPSLLLYWDSTCDGSNAAIEQVISMCTVVEVILSALPEPTKYQALLKQPLNSEKLLSLAEKKKSFISWNIYVDINVGTDHENVNFELFHRISHVISGMKNRFSTLDVFAVVHDLKKLVGQRVANVYDMDSKTYLIRIQKPDEKCFIMLESGCRIHKTTFDWPKAHFPSSFSMKLRKHIRHKRLECVTQLGVDRIIDMQFGFNEYACHVIVELYDRGNVLLTDNNYIILNVLRPRTDKETDMRFSVQERYPLEAARQDVSCPTKDDLMEQFKRLKKYGPVLIEHSLRTVGVPRNAQIGINIDMEESGVAKLFEALQLAHQIFNTVRSSATQGFLIYKEDTRMDGVIVETYQDRLTALKIAQVEREEMAELIELNSDLVDKALLVIRSAIANQLSWEAIEEMRINAYEAGNPIAASIVGLNLNSNEMTLLLKDPYRPEIDPKKKLHAEKKAAQQKQQKTISASSKALKSAKMKTKETLEVVETEFEIIEWLDSGKSLVHTKAEVMKKRRVMWFEKFLWFVSSENYLVIGGRDAQQNELLVKRYLRSGDIYVHADTRGASSIIIRNKLGGGDIPPRTLNEAATMAICYSSAWEAKVTTSAWWVHQHQNYLPTCQLQMGFGVMFQLDEESLERHKEERKVAPVLVAEDDIVDQSGGEDDGISLSGSDSEEEKDSDRQNEDFPDVQVNLQGIIGKGKSADEDDTYTIIQVGPLEQKKPDTRTANDIRDNDKAQKVNELKEDGKCEANTTAVEKKAEPLTRSKEEEDDELLETDMVAMDAEETKMLNSLTWRPLDKDILLFALVVVAPYQTMQNFKYKVKLTPGTGKRGKAAKNAIALFQRDKSANAQEMNLLKVLATDDQISRNIPGKVEPGVIGGGKGFAVANTMDTEVKEEESGSQVPPSKRFRRDDNVDPTNPDPSIVVHVRNLSPKATEADLLEALSHFGPISYATCMPGKRMALVEFEEVEGARSCVVYAQTNQIYVAGQAALFNYSTSKMIQRLGLESETPNHVLILTIYNAQYPVNVDVIHQICEPHGFVKRIAMIRRTMLQALVEFESTEIAKKAKHAMNGADIYSGCCTLKVEFAKPEHVKVTRNDMDQWDYTKAPQSGCLLRMLVTVKMVECVLAGDCKITGHSVKVTSIQTTLTSL